MPYLLLVDDDPAALERLSKVAKAEGLILRRVAAPDSAPLPVGTTLEEASRRLIEATLAACGSKREAADLLGISLKTLYNRLAAYKSEERDAA